MSSVQNLGNLTMLPTVGLAVQTPAGFAGFQGATRNVHDSYKTVADKAVQDSKDIPSIWFVNFPSEAAASQKELLAKYMQTVEDYRGWASLHWWKFAYAERNMPKDGSPQSIAKRSAYCARIADYHMKTTPWLEHLSDDLVRKSIQCQITEFHTELIRAVLDGFVTVTPGIFLALERILESLRNTMGQNQGNDENRTIVFERYEYVPIPNIIESVVRIISFTVTDSIKNVQNAKNSATRVKCEIVYSDYLAKFNQKLWSQEAEHIDKYQMKAASEFRQKQTIDCPP